MRTPRTRGMTLLEALVWVSVFTMAMLALTTSVLYFYRTSDYAIQEAGATASAQRGIDLMVRTLREASYASNGAYPIVSIAANDIKFFVNIDDDPQIEEVHYFLSGTNLVRGVVEPTGDPAGYTGAETTSTISEYVHNADQGVSLFTYYDKNGAQITNFAKVGDVRFVSLNLSVDVNPDRAPLILVLRSSAALRNLIGK